MTCTCPEGFLRSADPRRHSCNRCAKLPNDPLPEDRVTYFFDRMREALESAGRIKSPSPGEPVDPTFAWFQAACLARLRKGAESYGPANFLRTEVDLVNEALEEQLDCANYGLMEMVKHAPDETDAASLGEAVCFAFHSAQALLRYRAKMRGVSG